MSVHRERGPRRGNAPGSWSSPLRFDTELVAELAKLIEIAHPSLEPSNVPWKEITQDTPISYHSTLLDRLAVDQYDRHVLELKRTFQAMQKPMHKLETIDGYLGRFNGSSKFRPNIDHSVTLAPRRSVIPDYDPELHDSYEGDHDFLPLFVTTFARRKIGWSRADIEAISLKRTDPEKMSPEWELPEIQDHLDIFCQGIRFNVRTRQYEGGFPTGITLIQREHQRYARLGALYLIIGERDVRRTVDEININGKSIVIRPALFQKAEDLAADCYNDYASKRLLNIHR